MELTPDGQKHNCSTLNADIFCDIYQQTKKNLLYVWVCPGRNESNEETFLFVFFYHQSVKDG